MDDEQGQIRGRPNHKNGFSQYSLFPELFLNLMINKIRSPTPVQRKAIPLIMQGKDVVVCYKTGSGKTLSYILPMIHKLQSHSQIVGARALILIPTRELAEQITKVLKAFLHKIDLRYTLILGGHTYQGQFESLAINPDIIIATPGRLMQLLAETDLQLSRVQIIIFDEADQLFGESKFKNQLKEILSKCPTSQRLMFSATITPDLNDFALAGLRDYNYIHQEIALPEKMKIDFMVVLTKEKPAALLYLLEKVVSSEKAIIFVATRFHVDYLLALLGQLHECFGVYGKMDMEQRTFALDSFRRKKKSAILIVTDVAARGLDIPLLNFVVHYDYPSNHQIFVHRSGRTARAEMVGNTIALITHSELPFLAELATYVSKKITNSADQSDCINVGSIPQDILSSYVNLVTQLADKNSQIQNLAKMADRAFEKFKKCRTETSQNSLRKAKNLVIKVHHSFQTGLESDEQEFLQRIKQFTPKKSFLELQKTLMDKEIDTDPFLSAVDKIRKEQTTRESKLKKRQKLRQRNSRQWKQILDKKQLKQFEEYRQTLNNQRLPINMIEGIDIEVSGKVKKSTMKDFKNPTQYIWGQKNPNERTQFDDLPRIKNNEIDEMIQDENPVKKQAKKRVWDKNKKNFIWEKDAEDKLGKQQQGKKAYTQWKKKSKLALPKAGQLEDPEQVNMAKQNWLQRRKFRHGWKDNKLQGERRGVNRKNNKTKAVEKKMKTKLISKARNKKGDRGGRGGRGGRAGRGR